MAQSIFLFDLDGVLVRPGGYRAAVRATVNYFTNRLGLGDQAPDDATVAIFEAQSITCEWDMVPILIARALDEAAARSGTALPDLPTIEAAEAWMTGHPRRDVVVDFAPFLRSLGRFAVPGEAASDVILAECMDGHSAQVFPHLAGQGVLRDLLSESRRLLRSRTTRVFENYALGDVVFTRDTGLPAVVRSESLLAMNDEPLLSEAARADLLALRSAGNLAFAAYTARPSRPVAPPDELLAVYAAEAEMALERIGIPDFPLIGSGQTGEVAHRLGEKEDRLTKPSPYHALAAIAAAMTGDRLSALDWTERVYRRFERDEGSSGSEALNRLAAFSDLAGRLELHIFEDSPAGMRGGKHAAELIERLGGKVSLRLWGISDHPEKAAALRSEGAQVFADVNQAITAATACLPASR